MYNLNFLEAFLALAENLSFSKTAKQLHSSQPVISRQIKELELQLGKVLFLRTKKSVILTNDGTTLFNQLKNPYVAIKNALENKNEKLLQNATIDITIGGIPEATKNILVPIINEYKLKHQQYCFHVKLLGNVDVEENIINGKFDFGIVYTQGKRKTIHSIKLFNDCAVMIGPNDLHLKNYKVLDDIPIIKYSQYDAYTDDFITKNFSKKEIAKITYHGSISSHDEMIKLVNQLKCFAIIPLSSCIHEIENKKITMQLKAKTYYQISLIYHESLEQNPAKLEFIKHIQKNFSKA